MTRPSIVVLRALGLGDLLTGVPALRALRSAFPGADITLAAPSVLAPLAALSGAVDGVADVALPLRPLRPPDDTGPPRWAALPPALHGADIAVNLHGRGPESTMLLIAARPRRLISFAHPCLPPTSGLPRWRADEHEVARWCRLLTETGIPADPGRLELAPPSVPSPLRGALIIHPGAASGARRWPPGRWAAVACALRDTGLPVAVTGAPKERALAAEVSRLAGLPERSVLAGRTSLAGLAALTASAALVLSGDTGMAHLAAAYSRPAVTLAGPVPPRLWGPPPRPWHRVLWAGRPGDPHAAEPDPGLLELGPGDVIAAAREVLTAARGRAGVRPTARAGSHRPGSRA
ncbi:MAG: glycosyltransferase family 9 protein [Streptosporangiaceae bacterium]|nr:glycosyltransferase family 9 protein [Streptosporangiaceae bacterium]MBV9855918.1 glycosyltransferase family 9 protein [Streptosporangiaceae bacterium]